MVAKIILLHPNDNIVVVVAPLMEGEEVLIENQPVRITQSIGVGHKIARQSLKVGDKILRYGAPIGSLVADVEIGQHVHMHNMKSDYMPSHTRTQQHAFKGESV